jgi:hypothetical protein
MFDINILVNGNRCKQYNHNNGKTFIESKHGSEYSIEIKNNTWQRKFVMCSIDGLNIIDGKTAGEDGPGYIINAYSSNRYDGFRVSDEKVAKFVFDAKDKSYASSKEDGSEKNVGVIGVRIFDEKIKPLPTVIETTRWVPYPAYPSTHPQWIYGNDTTNTCCGGIGSSSYSCNSSFNIPTKTSGNVLRSCNLEEMISCNLAADSTLAEFDTGTKWGSSKESKVVEVEFERGLLTLSKDIYYASRQSLIHMGVPIGNEKQVSFPKSFDDKYAKPPKGWVGMIFM